MRVPMSWLRELVTLPPNVTTAQVADALTRAGCRWSASSALVSRSAGRWWWDAS